MFFFFFRHPMISPSAPPSAESSLHYHLSGRSFVTIDFSWDIWRKKTKMEEWPPKKLRISNWENDENGWKWMNMAHFFRENGQWHLWILKYSSFRETHWCMARTEWAEWPDLVVTRCHQSLGSRQQLDGRIAPETAWHDVIACGFWKPQ